MKRDDLDQLLFGHLGRRQSLSPAEVATALNVSLKTVYRWAEEEKITSAAFGNGLLRLLRVSVVDFFFCAIEEKKNRVAMKSADGMKKSAARRPGWVRKFE